MKRGKIGVNDTGWLLDTSILVDLLRGYSPARHWIDSIPLDRCNVSVVAAAELLAGCRNRAEQRKVDRELALYTMVWIDQDISRDALEFYRAFHLSHGVGLLDCLIGATARRCDLRLGTINVKHFRPLPGLRVERPY